MAIEFNCPYCTAAIRVPDEFSGKRGSCPKCATKLIVPDVVPKSGAAADVPPTPNVPSLTVASEVPSVPGSAVPEPPGVSGAAEPADFTAPPPTSVSRKLRRKSRRRKSQGVFGVAVPAVCFLMFLGLLAAFMYLRSPELEGSLRGSLVGVMDFPPATVSLHNLNLTDEEHTQAAMAFEGAPESFISPQMTCSVAVDGDNLQIDVRSGKGFAWFAVNPSSSTALTDWIRSQRTALNTVRLQTLAAAGSELCRDKVTKEGGTPVVFDAVRYRDSFGLSAHVDAFGFAVVAIVGNKLMPCAHEDSNGTLYFALPVGTGSFQLRGREVNGQRLFPGEYTVTVEGSAPAPAADSDDSTQPETPSDDSSTDEPAEDSEPQIDAEDMQEMDSEPV